MVCLIGATAPLRAEEPLGPAWMASSMKGLPLGGTRDAVLLFLGQRVEARYAPKLREATGPQERDRLTAEMVAEKAGFAGRVVGLKGPATGLEASVVRDEFLLDHSEELLKIQDGQDSWYLFFIQGRLYKAIKTATDLPFADTLARLERVYGPAMGREYDDPATRKTVRRAIWVMGRLRLVAEDRATLYQCVTLRWAVVADDDLWKAAWRKAQKREQPQNPILREALTPPPAGEERDPADAILNGKAAPVGGGK